MPTIHTPEFSNHEQVRCALAAEQVRLRHYRKALACAKDAALRRQWERQLQASSDRVTRLAIELAAVGEPVPAAVEHDGSARCLLEAMDMALCNGDMLAAEAVARECMRLIDMRTDADLSAPSRTRKPQRRDAAGA